MDERNVGLNLIFYLVLVLSPYDSVFNFYLMFL